MLRSLAAAACLSLLVACGSFQGVHVETADYAVGICADGLVVIPCATLGTVPVPAGGATFGQFVLALASPWLTKKANLKDCVVTTFPEATLGGVTTITASAVCTLNGVRGTENLKLTLTPVMAPAGASAGG